MNIDDISIADGSCIHAMAKGNIYIGAKININKGFECYQIYTRDCKSYYVPLVDDVIEGQEPIPEDIMNEANKILEPLGGIDYVIDRTQELYNKTIEGDHAYNPDDHFYENLGKDNIRSYCIS